jgi:hypothetical protein
MTNAAWQRALLPLMSGMVVLTSVFFAIVVLYQTHDLQTTLRGQASVDLSQILSKQEPPNSAQGSDLGYMPWKVAAILEGDLIRRRYEQGTATMLARIWTRAMGFITGMILALVGAAFVLGKLQERPSSVQQEAGPIKVSIASTSPGVILATLGTLLMSITLLTRFEIDTRDVAVYVQPSSPRQPILPPPLAFSPTDAASVTARERELFSATPRPKKADTSEGSASK